MDTKWRNIRNVFSFIIFFLGVSLTLGNASGLIRRLPGKISDLISGKLLEYDYQQSDEFRWHISNRLENFLSIAVKGCPADYYYEAGDIYYGDSREVLTYWNSGVVMDQGITEYWSDSSSNVQEAYRGYSQQEQLTEEQLTEEQIEERKKQIARRKQQITEMYFEGMEEDKNLLYSIYYEGSLLYSNTDLLLADGSMQVPEGYNFLLYFDGEKVRITKDGKQEDIYGDGYYRGGDEWYVPGYRNFPVDDGMKKAVICMAAAREPMRYTMGMYDNGGYRTQENGLYWMQYNAMSERVLLRRNLIGFAAGLALLFLSFFCRKGRRKFAEKLAGLQGKIWVECKIVLVAAVLLPGLKRIVENSGSALREITYIFAEGGMEAAMDSGYGGLLLSDLQYLSAWFWIVLFWTVYLTVNDLKHNRKVWEQGLIAKCCRLFSAKDLRPPLARKMERRSGILLGAAAFCGVCALATAAGLAGHGDLWENVGMRILFSLFILAFFGLFLSLYLVGKKNVKAAGEVDALAKRIGEICDGDYSGGGASEGDVPAGGDLETVRVQLENIRQGMADAVDEQMKSERMKVELIANVSHDLKTPLTSIISYVQFLKEEEGLPEHVKDYVRILDEKSERLKNMVQDVFAVSKAASGELPVCMEELDFGKLLRQTLADMDEEIRNSNVSFRTELPEEPVIITADGQRMYRVFQNLFQNALKYSLDGSRVYVTLKAEGKMAVACVKNTSHMELDEEKNFTERFFRGDKSRTDGGSGLGLSIAQSFTEACGGQFELDFNADLFIVRVSFQTDCV